MAFKWRRDLLEKLIICIEQNSCIYNVKSQEYLDRNKKAQAYISILEEMQKVEGSITLEEIKRKWKNLRTQYSLQLRKLHQSKKSGSGIADVYVPTLWCFEQLNFLKTHTEMRRSIDNIEISTQDIRGGSSSLQESLFDEPPKKKQKSAINVFRNELDNLRATISQRRNEKKFAYLGNLITSQMELIHPEDQADAAWQLQCFMQRLMSQSVQRRRSDCNSSLPEEFLEESESSSSFPKDILELSMEGIFDDDDFN